MKLIDVNNLTEDQGREWAKFIWNQTSLESFKAEIGQWKGLVDDVVKVIDKWTLKDFKDFKKCLALERRGVFSGEKNAARFASVMIPELMFKASVLAQEVKVPWGLAINRLVEVGKK